MAIEQAIREAIEGGWSPKESDDVLCYFSAVGLSQIIHDRDEVFDGEQISIVAEIFLDPSFWQSLGKALGWWINLPKIATITTVFQVPHAPIGKEIGKISGTVSSTISPKARAQKSFFEKLT